MDVLEDYQIDFNLLLKSEILDVASLYDMEHFFNVEQEKDYQKGATSTTHTTTTTKNNAVNTIIDVKNEILPPNFEIKGELQIGEDEVLDNILPRFLENALKESLNEREQSETCAENDSSLLELTAGKYPRLATQDKTEGLRSNNKLFKCNMCGKKFIKKSSLDGHLKDHVAEKDHDAIPLSDAEEKQQVSHEGSCSGERPHHRTFCNAPLSVSNGLKGHTEKSHTGVAKKSHQCILCGAAYADMGTLRLHQRRQCAKKPYRCQLCDASYFDVSSLKRHQITHTGSAEKQHKCKLCDVSYFFKSCLKKHELKHLGEMLPVVTPRAKTSRHRPYQCKFCDIAFSISYNLKKHVVKVHTGVGEKSPECLNCGAAFDDIATLRLHQRKQCDKKPYRCQLCEASYSNSSTLKSHHQARHTGSGEKPNKCNLCDAAYYDVRSLKNHQTNKHHAPNALFQCTMCSKKFYTATDLRSHTKIHTPGEKPHKCVICNSAYYSKALLVAHNRKHTGERPFKCLLCNASFPVKCTLVRHLKWHSGARPFKCNICNAAYLDKQNLMNHQRSHTGEKPFQCHICGMMLSNAISLHSHVKSHSKDPLHCKECNVEFTYRHQLTAHQKMHRRLSEEARQTEHSGLPDEAPQHRKIAEKQPFKCHLCNHVSLQKINFIVHLRKHSGEKPYKCDQCGSAFAAYSGLYSHLKKHSSKKPYKCTTCFKAFKFRQGLIEHQRTHTGERPHQCDSCDFAFAHVSNLIKHRRTAHNLWHKK